MRAFRKFNQGVASHRATIKDAMGKLQRSSQRHALARKEGGVKALLQACERVQGELEAKQLRREPKALKLPANSLLLVPKAQAKAARPRPSTKVEVKEELRQRQPRPSTKVEVQEELRHRQRSGAEKHTGHHIHIEAPWHRDKEKEEVDDEEQDEDEYQKLVDEEMAFYAPVSASREDEEPEADNGQEGELQEALALMDEGQDEDEEPEADDGQEGEYDCEYEVAQRLGVPWQLRGPPGPSQGGPKVWKNQRFRAGSGKWANRGGWRERERRAYLAAKGKGEGPKGKGPKGKGKGPKGKGKWGEGKWIEYYEWKVAEAEERLAEENAKGKGPQVKGKGKGKGKTQRCPS